MLEGQGRRAEEDGAPEAEALAEDRLDVRQLVVEPTSSRVPPTYEGRTGRGRPLRRNGVLDAAGARVQVVEAAQGPAAELLDAAAVRQRQHLALKDLLRHQKGQTVDKPD